jgi:lysyl-tRNA synthetase class 2
MSLESKANLLADRAHQFKKVRAFFDERCVMEVDTPLLVQHPNLDAQIELFQAFDGKTKRYLHTSPEFGMKRLLASLKKDIYQMSHVFRAFEVGKKHNPEFTMIEYYRIGKTLDFLIDETLNLIFLFIEPASIQSISYYDLFYKYTKIDLRKEKIEELHQYLENNELDYPQALSFYELVDLIFCHFIEPFLNGITVIKGFPHWQKALAKLENLTGALQAKRFEIYFNGIELANGYDELLDPKEQLLRFQEVVDERSKNHQTPYTIDSNLIVCLDSIPECVGVAIGFDRLMMIRHQAVNISQVIPFSFSEI